MTRTAWTVLVAAAAFVAGGCGGDSGGRDDATDEAAEADGDAPADDAAGDADAPDVPPDGPDGDGEDDAGPPDGPDGEEDVAPPDGEDETTPDGAADAEEDADAPGDDGGGGWAGILCGWGICETGTEVCCVSEMPPVTQECVAPGSCAAGMSVVCDGPEDCASSAERCCLPSGAVMATYCHAGTCPAGDTACHADTDCGAGEACCPGTLLGWAHHACRAAPCP